MPHIDFDAAWAETEREPLTITVRGETFELPARRPARHVLAHQRLMADQAERDVTAEELQQYALGVFPEAVRERLVWELEPALDEDELVDIMRRVDAIYRGLTPEEVAAAMARANGQTGDGEKQQEADGSGEGKRRSPRGSSTGGRRSKGTSKRTTAST